jgi:hypothetical protein
MLIAEPSAGRGHCVPVPRGLFPLRLEILAQYDDSKLSFGQDSIHCLVNFWVGATEVEPADSDVFAGRFGGDGPSVSCGKPVLQKIHSLRDMSYVPGHRADGIKMVRVNRDYTLQGNPPEYAYRATC